jgi:hypothetical protein
MPESDRVRSRCSASGLCVLGLEDLVSTKQHFNKHFTDLQKKIFTIFENIYKINSNLAAVNKNLIFSDALVIHGVKYIRIMFPK